MKPGRLCTIRKRLDAASLKLTVRGPTFDPDLLGEDGWPRPTAVLLAHAPHDIDALLEEVTRLQLLVAKLRRRVSP